MKLWAALTLILVVSGCTVGKKAPRRVHVGQPVVAQDVPATPPDRKTDFFGVDLNQLYTTSQRNDAASLRQSHILAPLSARLLSQDYLGRPEFKGHSQSRWALMFFNTQLLTALKENPKSSELQTILRAYGDRVLAGCDWESLMSCRNLPFFREDNQTSAVLKYVALNEADVRRYYRILSVASDLKGDPDDKELDQMFAQRLIEFLKLFVNATNDKGFTKLSLKSLSDAQKKEYLFYSDFLTASLRNANLTQLKGETALELFNWLSADQIDVVLGRDLSDAILDLVSTQIESKEVWSRFIEIFRRDQSAEELSYTNALKRVNQHDPQLLAHLGVEPYDLDAKIKERSKELAGIMFLTRVFDLRPVKRERYLWKIAQLPPDQAMRIIEAYIRVTLIDRALDTNARMAKFYVDYQHDGRSKEQLMWEAMRYANQNLTPRWKDYVSRVQRLEQFYADEYEKMYGNDKDSPLGKQSAQLRNLFEQVNPSIKYLVTYPNMIMLGYYAAKLNLELQIESMFGGKFKINKDLILHDLMDGNISPMFLFTSYRQSEDAQNFNKLDSVQMLWSLYFAMALDLPKMYNISAVDFLRTFFQAYKARTDGHMRELIEKQRVFLRQNSPLQQMFAYCALPESASGVFDNQMELGELQNSTFFGDMGQNTRQPFKTAHEMVNLGAQDLEKSLDEAIETLRSDVDPKMRRLFLVKSAFKVANSTNDKALNEIDAQMSETLDLRKRLLQSSRELINRLPGCMLRMHRIEDQRRHELAAIEIEFLKQVDQVLHVSDQTRDDARTFELLKRQPFFADLDSTQTLPRALNDLIARKLQLNDVFEKVADYKFDYFSRGGFQKDSNGRLFFNYRSSDVYVRMAQMMMFGFDGKSLAPHMDRIRVVYPDSMKEFERRVSDTKSDKNEFAIYATKNNGAVYTAFTRFRDVFTWFGDIYQQGGDYRALLRQAVALYKFDYLGDLDLERAVSCDVSCQARKKQEVESRTVELLNVARQMLDETRMKPEDLPLLDAYQAKSFYNLKNEPIWTGFGPQYLFLDSDLNHSLLGFTDELFTYITSVRLGFDPVFRGLRPYAEDAWKKKEKNDGQRIVSAEELIRRADYFQNALSYYATLRDKPKVLIFNIDPAIDKQIDLFHTLYIRTDMELKDIFMETAERWTQKNPLPMVQFSLAVPPQQMGLISRTLYTNYQAQMRDFHEQTAHVFENLSDLQNH